MVLGCTALYHFVFSICFFIKVAVVMYLECKKKKQASQRSY